MKEKIIYIIVFLAAFALTSGGVLYMNSHYKDIFKFDFTPIKTVHKTDSKKANGTVGISSEDFSEFKIYMQKEFKNEIFDSLKSLYKKSEKVDTVYAKVFKDSVLLDSLNNISRALKETKDILFANQKKLYAAAKAQDNSGTMKDSNYVEWTKQTAKLYEAMDPRKAAKIIQSYSDNVARDILYTMRQKKAADILAELNPETANRITKAK